MWRQTFKDKQNNDKYGWVIVVTLISILLLMLLDKILGHVYNTLHDQQSLMPISTWQWINNIYDDTLKAFTEYAPCFPQNLLKL